MELSWTMDKIGPIARSVEDCALVLDAIHGFDGQDMTAVDQPFEWPPRGELSPLRVGYFEGERPEDERPELDVLRQLGVKLVQVKLPEELPSSAVVVMLDTEAASAFDALTRQGITEGLNEWPNTFRRSEFVPAVEYLRAARVRTLLMRQMDELMRDVDLYVGGNDLVITNLTGHPTVVLPFGTRRRTETGQPGSIKFTGRLFGESELLAVADAFQRATGDHLRHPPADVFLPEADEAP
jgi:Asp-tRNA(Asn)/Glu-tRNA(Gln) amidotransferase A subunit family amidase